MDKIKIVDLEVWYHVGVTDEERAKPQRLLLSLELVYDMNSAITTDRIQKAIDYSVVAAQLQKFGEGRNWKLLEKLAANMTTFVLAEFDVQMVTIEVKKFVIPQAQYVSVVMTRKR